MSKRVWRTTWMVVTGRNKSSRWQMWHISRFSNTNPTQPRPGLNQCLLFC